MDKKILRKNRKSLSGTVIGRSGDKTIKVACFYKVPHPMYGKEIKRKTVVSVHDERNEGNVGDSVRIVETRPLSRTKRWRLESIVSVASVEK